MPETKVDKGTEDMREALQATITNAARKQADAKTPEEAQQWQSIISNNQSMLNSLPAK